MSSLCNARRHPLYYESILRGNSICSDCPLHSGSDLSVSSLPVMHRVIRKLWMDRPTFRQPAGVQCSLNTPLCRQSAGKQYQRGGSTWGRGFHIAPRCLKTRWESSLTLALSLPLITATFWKPFMGNVQKLSVFVLVCVCMCIHERYLLAKGPLQTFFTRNLELAKVHSANFKRVNGLGHFSSFKSVWLPVSKLCNLHLWVCVMEPRTLEGGWGYDGSWWSFGGLDGGQSPVFIVTLQSPLCISTI